METMFVLVLCLGAFPASCDYNPLTARYALTRKDCIEHLHFIHALNPQSRIFCVSGDRNGEIIDSAGRIRRSWHDQTN